MKSNRNQVLNALKSAAREGLNEAAQIYTNNMKRALRGGFTSGDFVTGNLMNSVTRTSVTENGNDLEVKVGTNVPYAVYWEVGHHNIYTRKFEREERWRPTLLSSMASMRDAIRNAFGRKS